MDKMVRQQARRQNPQALRRRLRLVGRASRRSLSRLFAAFTCLILAALGGPASAHPNITMTCRVLFNFAGNSVDGIGEVWTFDAGFSAELLKDFDANKDGLLSDAEAAAMGKDVMKNLGDSRDFTYVFVDGHDLGAIKTEGFRARAENGIVSIAFGVPLKTPVDPRIHKLSVEIKDEEFFVFATFATDRPVLMRGEGAAADACMPKLVDDPAGAYFGGAIIPSAATLVCG
ncbi:DUF1007 family protein [Jiella mangrovi]|uniref:DUF1007 family protein n=1 Tax=Jiella mangrovi TaxID=2821407 RepID=A0ABS4BHK1_9HYPH|nr:DUF1007 family protein [Jiella mangrovi]MBP0616224.1 DUF1007 family protein [Jiella mangrovi]